MPRFKQAFSWWCFSKQEPNAFFKSAKAIGYAGVELAPPELWDTIKGAGLEVASHMVGPIEQGLNRTENHAKMEEPVLKAIDAAAKYGCPNVVVFAGNRGPGINDEQAAANTAEGLKKFAKAAESKGVNLLLELLNSKVDHKLYQCDRTAWGVGVMKAVNSPRVKLLYDIYHMQIMEGDLIRTLRESIAYIGHIHTAGNPGRNEPDEKQEINYPAVYRTLADLKYNGYVGHEFLAKGDPIASLRAAYEACANA